MELIDNVEVSNYSDPRSEGEIEADLRALTNSNPDINQDARTRALNNTTDLMFNGSLSLNMAAIAEQVPIIVSRQKRENRGHEGELTQINLKLSKQLMTRISIAKERHPSLFKTSLDVARYYFALGQLVGERILMSPEFLNHPQYKTWLKIDNDNETEGWASLYINRLRQSAAFFIDGAINREEFIHDVEETLEGCTPGQQHFVQPIAEKLMSEHGLDDETRKLKERNKKKKQRNRQKESRGNLRVVGGIDFQEDGDSDIED